MRLAVVLFGWMLIANKSMHCSWIPTNGLFHSKKGGPFVKLHVPSCFEREMPWSRVKNTCRAKSFGLVLQQWELLSEAACTDKGACRCILSDKLRQLLGLLPKAACSSSVGWEKRLNVTWSPCSSRCNAGWSLLYLHQLYKLMQALCLCCPDAISLVAVCPFLADPWSAPLHQWLNMMKSHKGTDQASQGWTECSVPMAEFADRIRLREGLI